MKYTLDYWHGASILYQTEFYLHQLASLQTIVRRISCRFTLDEGYEVQLAASISTNQTLKLFQSDLEHGLN